MKNKTYISVVVVTDQVTEAFVSYIADIHRTMTAHFSLYEVIVVVNGADMALLPAAEARWKEFSQPTVVIVLTHRHSHEVAGYVGLEYTKGDYILEVDHSVEVLPETLVYTMVDEMERGYDIVSATPQQQMPFFSRSFYRLLDKTAVVPFRFETEYARLVTRRAVNALFQLKQRVKYRKLLYAYTGFRRSVVPVTDPLFSGKRREAGFFERAGLATDIFISYSSIVLRVTLFMAVFFMLFSIGGGFYSLIIYFVKDVHVEGWSTLMLLLALGLSGIFFILAMMVKYLEIILRETQSSPLYIVKSVSVISHGESRPHV